MKKSIFISILAVLIILLILPWIWIVFSPVHSVTSFGFSGIAINDKTKECTDWSADNKHDNKLEGLQQNSFFDSNWNFYDMDYSGEVNTSVGRCVVDKTGGSKGEWILDYKGCCDTLGYRYVGHGIAKFLDDVTNFIFSYIFLPGFRLTIVLLLLLLIIFYNYMKRKIE